jgi:hypothetical protein
MINDDEYNNKVFEEFKDKYKDFKTSFVILLGFAVIFFYNSSSSLFVIV